MYNRYIPQPDGSYRRSRQSDIPPSPPQPRREEVCQPPRRDPPAECRPQPREEPPCQKGPNCGNGRRQGRPAPPPPPPRQRRSGPEPQAGAGVGGFLRQLLPKDFCTEDLLIVLLLLLMSGGDEDNQNIALLTLGLYLFL